MSGSAVEVLVAARPLRRESQFALRVAPAPIGCRARSAAVPRNKVDEVQDAGCLRQSRPCLLRVSVVRLGMAVAMLVMRKEGGWRGGSSKRMGAQRLRCGATELCLPAAIHAPPAAPDLAGASSGVEIRSSLLLTLTRAELSHLHRVLSQLDRPRFMVHHFYTRCCERVGRVPA